MTDEELKQAIEELNYTKTDQVITILEKNIALRRQEEQDAGYYKDREMSMREATTGIKFMKDVTETLGQREKRYGEYVNVATTAQQLKETLRSGASWGIMEPYMQESLDLIANKLARIVNGDPFYDDSWHDVGGYAKLVEIELTKGK